MFLGFIAISEFGFITGQVKTVIQFFKFYFDSESRLIFFYILHEPLSEYLVLVFRDHLKRVQTVFLS